MTVISFSIDEQIKSDVEGMAKEERCSKSDIFRNMKDLLKLKFFNGLQMQHPTYLKYIFRYLEDDKS